MNDRAAETHHLAEVFRLKPKNQDGVVISSAILAVVVHAQYR